MRLPEWDIRLIEVIERHEKAPFSWGLSDCWTLMMDSVEALWGPDWVPYQHITRKYRDERGAAKMLQSAHARDIGDLIEREFEETPMALAQRGDLCIATGSGVMAGGVVFARHVIGKGVTGIRRAPCQPTWRYFAVR
jgi:hypothetical protein